MSAESAAPYAIPHAVVSKIGSSRRCICIDDQIAAGGDERGAEAERDPGAALPPLRAASSSGRKSSTTPPTPSDAPTSARAG